MEETFEGTFYFDTEKQDWCVKFVKSNGKEAVIKCQQNQISSNLPQNKDAVIEVKFETDKRYYREVLNIRSKNETANEAVMSDNYAKELKIQKEQEEKAAENKSPRPEGDFHNPYNFIPAPPRDVAHPELGDHAPNGHDRYISDKLSGKLTVKMTVKTPLVVLDTAKLSFNANDKTHKEFPVRTDANGKPFINPTAVKGMLRSAYEAVTNSRMSSFTKHEDKLAFRAEVNEGLFVIPARIEGLKGKEKIVFYTGKSSVETDGGPKIIQKADKIKHKPEIRQSQYAGWIRMYETNEFENVNGEKKFAMSNTRISLKNTAVNNPKHPNKAWAWIEEFNHGRFKYWKVMEIAYDQADLSTSLTKSYSSISVSPEKVEGYICNTGKTMKGKHDERFFFGRNSTYDINLQQHHIDYWNKLIKDYRKQHESDFDSPPKEKIKNHSDRSKNGKEYSLEWSRHIQRTTKEEITEKTELIAEELKDGTLCYARVKQIGSTFDVLELYPVMISRRLHKVSPDDLLENTNLEPAKSIDELSAADRVFGWVGKGISKNGNYRGQIRFGSVSLTEDSENKPIGDIIQKFGQENSPDSWLPLNILGQPKPQQGRFYVAKNKQGKAQVDGLNNENAGYNLPSVKGLRGRKVYPHQAKLSDDYWTNRNNQNEFVRPNKEQDSQNRSIQGWIKPKTEFQFDIHFTNLSKVELGALVWLLNLNGENKNKYFHRFGGGKPYGFGSVKLEIFESDVRDGKNLETFYMSLDDKQIGKLDEISVKILGDDFKNLANSIFPKIIESFLRACEGFSDKPTHYPRKDEDLTAETKSFDWFVVNNKIEKGTVKNGYVLQDLANDDGLPYFD